MQYLIYYRIQSDAVRQRVIAGLQHIAEQVVVCDGLITITSYCTPLTMGELLCSVQDFMGDATLAAGDVLYVFYPTEDHQISVWPLKRAGKTRMLKWKLPERAMA